MAAAVAERDLFHQFGFTVFEDEAGDRRVVGGLRLDREAARRFHVRAAVLEPEEFVRVAGDRGEGRAERAARQLDPFEGADRRQVGLVGVDRVGDRVAEAVGAAEARFRRVGEAAVGFEVEAAVGRLGVGDDRRGFTAVVGEDAFRAFDAEGRLEGARRVGAGRVAVRVGGQRAGMVGRRRRMVMPLMVGRVPIAVVVRRGNRGGNCAAERADRQRQGQDPVPSHRSSGVRCLGWEAPPSYARFSGAMCRSGYESELPFTA